MDATTQLPQVLARTVVRVLRPVFRVLLRHGMSYTAFDDLARRVYVDLAIREFGIPGKKPSISRASILSGFTRKEVQRLVAEQRPLDTPDPAGGHDNRAARVLTAWTRDPDFIGADGQPRLLAPQDGPASFAELVRRHSGDMPVRAVLDELLRVGAVARQDDGRLALVSRVFLPRRGVVDKLDLLGTDVADLVTTIDHNIQHGDTDPRFQRRVMYRDMPHGVVAEFRRMSAEQSMDMLRRLDRWLAAQPDEPASTTPGQGDVRVRLGLGIYYFEERLEPTPEKEDLS